MKINARYEAGSQVMSGTISKLEAALVREGVIFLDDDGDSGPGVRLRRQLPLKLAEDPETSKRTIAWRPKLGASDALGWIAQWHRAHLYGKNMREISLADLAAFDALPSRCRSTCPGV